MFVFGNCYTIIIVIYLNTKTYLITLKRDCLGANLCENQIKLKNNCQIVFVNLYQIKTHYIIY